MIEFIIDDQKITAEKDTTILKAALDNNIYIPHLCWDRRLKPFGGCRMCLVEVEGHSRFFASCATPAENGMVIHTETEEILKARKMVLDLLLVHHPLDCPVCDKAGNCQLQDLAYKYGPSVSRFVGEKNNAPEDITNPLIERNPNRCITCGRCVKVCWEHQGVGAINFIGRGFDTKISPPFEETLNCEFCGQCIDSCPVGALGNKPFRHRARAWFLEHKHNICPYCAVGCTIRFDIREGKILNAQGDELKGINKGDLCAKGRYGFDFIYAVNRLKTPMLRKDGELKPCTWEEAAYFVARRLRQIISEKGPDKIGAIGSPRCSNEDNYMLQKFMREVVGTNNIDSSAAFGYGKIQRAIDMTFGLSNLAVDHNSPLNKDVILLFESDVTSTHPIWGLKFIEARQKGSHLIVADPRETKISRHAQTWLRIRPGTSQALAYGIMKLAADEGLPARIQMPSGIGNYEAMLRVIQDFTPEVVSEITGIGTAEFIDAAMLFINAAKRLVVMSVCPADNNKGINTAIAVSNLVMFMGDGPAALQMPAEYSNTFGIWKMGVTPDYLPGYRKIEDKPGKGLFKMLYEPDQISALYIMGEDPLIAFPDLKKLEQTFDNLDLVVVQDIRLTETSRYAHVVLPATSWAEKDGTFISSSGQSQKVYKIVSPAGEAIPDWQIFRNLYRVMHVPTKIDSLKSLQDEIAALGIQPGSGAVSPGMNQKWNYVPMPFNLPRDANYPLTMVTGNLMQHSGALSVMSKSLTHVISDAFIQISEEDAIKYKLEDGNQVRIHSANGVAMTKVRVTDELPEGMLFAPIHFKHGRVNELTYANEDGTISPVNVNIELIVGS
ncbi:molybdopterin-dependent oxidoreductase [Candidatus Magnetobacterium casense]|uniref:Molybdopterin-dependent oxidoreductase n=1 Tax=Candidatus Magnetobacterium casense TaxID=1455061 RepID=A0ABS6RWP5_9BACT|nr:molybdopterin-dependent oxidoreductase [Candidatus Magnetobacterium casensis]MBV6341006.1 molybdopterin-dependent oxidoreductase [Candidatus Magnetobacterium casensis]